MQPHTALTTSQTISSQNLPSAATRSGKIQPLLETVVLFLLKGCCPFKSVVAFSSVPSFGVNGKMTKFQSFVAFF